MALIKETTNRLIQHLNKKNPNLIENIKHPVVISSIENPNVDEKKDLENLKIIQWNSRKMKGKPKQDRIKIDICRMARRPTPSLWSGDIRSSVET